MSKYDLLWKYVKDNFIESLVLSFDKINEITGIPIDHSFLKYKKELFNYGYQVKKISMKEKTVSFCKLQIEIKPLVPDLISDYFDFFENRAFTDNSPYRCYCQVYQMTSEQSKYFDNAKQDEYGNISKRIAQEQIKSGLLKGYLAYVEKKVIGWCNANDKSFYTVIAKDIPEAYAQTEEKEKAVVCFEIAPELRNKGIATRLLQYAVDDARKDGYKWIDAFPDIRDERYEWDCKGPVHLYEKVGFAKVEEKSNYIIMRKNLD